MVEKETRGTGFNDPLLTNILPQFDECTTLSVGHRIERPIRHVALRDAAFMT